MRLVIALNSVNSQVWAFLIVLTGCVFVLAFHRAGIDIGIAAGIIGVGANMFTSANRTGQSDRPTLPGQTPEQPQPSQPK